MGYETIEFGIDDGIAKITLSRPDKLNAFNGAMHEEMRQALKTVSSSDARVLWLTGSGKGFCAGQDLSERDPSRATLPDLGETLDKNFNPLIRAITELPMPVVCGVNGVAAGAGANLALICDLVVAAESASFIQAFCKLGLVPDCGGTWILPRLIGHARATALSMLGDRISAQKAQEWGMILRCVPDAALESEASHLVEHLSRQPTKGLALIKRALQASAHHTLPEQLDLERDLQHLAGQTQDFREGVSAFLEKRPPQFEGR